MLHQALLLTLTVAAGEPAKPAAAPATTTTPAITDQSFRTSVLQPRAGKVVFVSFWATYCVPCLDELPGLVKLKKKLAKHGADIVFVNVDPPGDTARVTTLLDKKKLALGETFVVVNDDPQPFIEAVDPKWAGEVPYGALYGKDGALLRGFSGERPLAEIELAMVAALEGKPQPTAKP